MIGLGAQELIIILIIIIVLFGATRIPQLGKGIGLALRNFKKATSELEEKKQESKAPSVETDKPVNDTLNHPE